MDWNAETVRETERELQTRELAEMFDGRPAHPQMGQILGVLQSLSGNGCRRHRVQSGRRRGQDQ